MHSKEYVRKIDSSGLRRQRDIWRVLRIDPILLLLLLLLSLVGLAILYSASSRDVEMVSRQGVFILVGFIAMVASAHVPALFYRRSAPIFYCVGLLLLAAVLVFGDHSKGAQRWLDIPGLIRFQPAELMKIAMPLMVAWYLSARILPPKLKYIIAVLLMAFIPSAMIALQPDLGTALLVASSGLFVVLLAGLRWRYLMIAGFVAALCAWPMWHFILHDYQRNRILTLLDPGRDKFGLGWNILQSKTAIGSGGFWGTGWLQGTQSRLDFLPEGHTDFILAVLAEEWGLFGVSCLLILYFCIISRMLVLAWSADTLFNKLVVGSIGLTFFVYVFVNMGMVSGMLPVVGIPLPFISRGGTAIVSLMLALGIAMALAFDKKQFARN